MQPKILGPTVQPIMQPKIQGPRPRYDLAPLQNILLTLVVLFGAGSLWGCAAPAAESAPVGVAPALVEQKPGVVEVRFDQARGLTTVRITPPSPLLSGGRPALFAGTSFLGRRLTRRGSVLFGFQSTGKSWRFAECQQMALSADGVSLGVKQITRDTQLGAGQLTEFVSGFVSPREMNLLAAASRVTVKLCQQEMNLPEAELRLIKLFVLELAELSAP